MHPEQRALLDAVIADPSNNVPRLVYADWLEEHTYADYCAFCCLHPDMDVRSATCSMCDGSGVTPGERYAYYSQYIRVSCEAERQVLGPRRTELYQQSYNLLDQCQYSRRPCLFWGDTSLGSYTHSDQIMRGFVQRLHVPGAAMSGIGHLDAICKRQPIQALVVRNWGGYEQVISSRITQSLRALHLEGFRMTRSEVRGLVSYSHYNGWRHTLEELSVDSITGFALELLRERLPQVRLICNDGVFDPIQSRDPVADGS